MAFLQLWNVAKRFGATVALDEVSLAAEADELLVVLGPTGAGKTTLLRTIAGLELPQSGRVEMDGTDITKDAPATRDVALVFQNFSLYPRWSVRRNLAFPLRAPARRLSNEEIRERVEWAARLLRIEPLLDRDVTRLSGGEMQRVAIGRAIVRRPRIFLMDEPLSNLDAKLREALRVELVCLRRELGVPMVFVTHDQAEALSMGDRIAVLCEGRILQVGTPEEVYQQPVSPQVALQLGQPRINLFDTDFAVAARLPRHATKSQTRTLGIRPEDIWPEGGPTTATVKVVEEMGPSKVMLVDWLGRDTHLIVPPTFAVRPGDTIHPNPDPNRILRFSR